MKRRGGAEDGLSRREVLMGSGVVLGGMALTGCGHSQPQPASADDPTQQYTYFENLKTFTPGTPLEDDELRITFVGSGFPPPRRAQAEMSVFVEVGPWTVDSAGYGQATDSFLFDIGSGAFTNTTALNISPAKLDKVFISHLHGDHMGDLPHLYWFGPSSDRKAPLFVFGPSASGVPTPEKWGSAPAGTVYDDGTRAMCEHLRSMMRWGTESFSFQTTSTPDSKGVKGVDFWVPDTRGAVGDDPAADGYAIVPVELDWTKSGEQADDNIAYRNDKTGVTIRHFPVIHTRKGSIGYVLDWNGMKMLYSSDTKPEYTSLGLASEGEGLDVYIHEMILPADVLTMKMLGITDPSQVPAEYWQMALSSVATVQNSSHTPQGAYGYMLSQINPKPRLAVATHFTTSDDTVEVALGSIRDHVPGVQWEASGEILDDGKHPAKDSANITWTTDLMVLRVFPDKILIQRAEVSDYAYQAVPVKTYAQQNAPKYDDGDSSTLYGDPYAQIDASDAIPQNDQTYRADGW